MDNYTEIINGYIKDICNTQKEIDILGERITSDKDNIRDILCSKPDWKKFVNYYFKENFGGFDEILIDDDSIAFKYEHYCYGETATYFTDWIPISELLDFLNSDDWYDRKLKERKDREGEELRKQRELEEKCQYAQYLMLKEKFEKKNGK